MVPIFDLRKFLKIFESVGHQIVFQYTSSGFIASVIHDWLPAAGRNFNQFLDDQVPKNCALRKSFKNLLNLLEPFIC